MDKISTVVDIERGLAVTIDTMIFYMQKIRQGGHYSAEDREKALAEIEKAMPLVKRLLWRIKTTEMGL